MHYLPIHTAIRTTYPSQALVKSFPVSSNRLASLVFNDEVILFVPVYLSVCFSVYQSVDIFPVHNSTSPTSTNALSGTITLF